MDEYKNSRDMEDEIFNIVTDLLRDDISKNEAIDKLLALYNVSQCNWFERFPLHWRYVYYMVGGILIGLLLPYVW